MDFIPRKRAMSVAVRQLADIGVRARGNSLNVGKRMMARANTELSKTGSWES